MASAGRYEIVDTIASGDFATVCRGRDRELGREVAIKQIHQQFLNDPRQLERYWREAQLLASLQHPNILTIYDLVRSRGWLILELMRGSLQRSIQVGPIDLDYLRVVLVHSLSALHFLHVNGIIHGDVKPSNLLVDPQNRVKLGDFGLARRASSEQGSLLKGTTKYMAPELVSNQFGAIGPASDLYSLGFTAYELMCGPQFESLFPGLSTFGRDRQIAWLMWQAAPDRNLPEITRVLEGVPDDLVRVVSRLVAKDQSRRYHSAQEVLHDLRPEAMALGQIEAADEAIDAQDARKKRLRRLAAILALACSLLVCVLMLLPNRPKPAPSAEPQATRGTVRQIYVTERKLVIERADDGRPLEIEVKPRDEIVVNDKKELLRGLQPGDRATVETYRDVIGRRITRIVASRPLAQQGRIKEIDVEQGKFTLVFGDDEQTLVVSVPATTPILFNGRKDLEGKPPTLADLRVDDRVVVQHVGEETGRSATELSVERVVSFEGVIRDVEAKKGELTVAQGDAANVKLQTWPFAPKCEVTVNDRRFLDQQMLKPADLKPGDKVTVAHDSQVVRVNAYRVLGQDGVIQSVQYGVRTLEVRLAGQDKPTTFLAGPKCKITLSGETAEIVDLRPGDLVDITHDTPGSKAPEALTIAARRPTDSSRWAILVAGQTFDDRSLAPLEYALADAQLLQETLIKRYGVPEAQSQLFSDASQVRLEQGLPDLLRRIPAESKLLVYLVGQGYRDGEGNVYFAPRNFNSKQPAASGVPLQWFVDQMEKCAAGEKLLLLDCSSGAAGATAAGPSTAEMIRSLKAPPGVAALRTVTAVASCSPGQQGYDWPEKKHGLFAAVLAQGYSGAADKNHDNRVEITELFGYLNQTMASVGSQIGHIQTPVLFLPDSRPPRLTEEAKKAIRALAVFLREDRVDPKAVALAYNSATEAAGKELEPGLLYGLVLVRAKKRADAISHFERLRTNHPEMLLPLQSLAWLRFAGRTYQTGVDELAVLVSRIPRPKPASAGYPEETKKLFFWAGQLREFAATVQDTRPVTEESLKKLDDAVAAHGESAVGSYEEGRKKTKAVAGEFDKQLEGDLGEAAVLKIRVDRRQLPYYASFPFADATQQILAGLDQ